VVSEKRDRRRSVLPLVFARQIREGWTGREDPAGLSDEKRDRVRRIAGFRDLKQKMRRQPAVGSIGPGRWGRRWSAPTGQARWIRRLEYILDYILKADALDDHPIGLRRLPFPPMPHRSMIRPPDGGPDRRPRRRRSSAPSRAPRASFFWPITSACAARRFRAGREGCRNG
jgi:hypothetical protein